MEDINKRFFNLNGIISDNDIKRIWGINQFRIFISHLSDDKKYASNIKDKLCKIGISCFVAHNDIDPGTYWIDELEKALLTSNVCLCLLSENYHNSNWTDQEIGFSYGLGKQIIPVNLGVLPYGLIQKFQAINISCGINNYDFEIL